MAECKFEISQLKLDRGSRCDRWQKRQNTHAHTKHHREKNESVSTIFVHTYHQTTEKYGLINYPELNSEKQGFESTKSAKKAIFVICLA